MSYYKMIQGITDCPICKGSGVAYNPCRLCDCAKLFDVNIPEGALSQFESCGQLTNYPADNPEPKEVLNEMH